MANETIDKKIEKAKDLPSTVQGNGQNFIYLLKKYLEQLTKEVNDKFVEVSKFYNAIIDAPTEIKEQLRDLRVKERRVGTKISLELTWNSTKIKNYSGANIYVYETKMRAGIDWSTVELSRTISTPLLSSYVLENVTAGFAYRIVVQGKNSFGSVSEKDNAPTLTYEVSNIDNVPLSPVDFTCYITKDGVLWKWQQPVGADTYISELRTDQNPSSTVGLLELTQLEQSTVAPPTREGVAYLYNKGYGSRYSEPVSTSWSKPVPLKPQNFRVTSIFQGLRVEYARIPQDCQGICISINGELHRTTDEVYTYNCSTGTYKAKVAYYDSFGEGTWTDEVTISTAEKIPPNAVHITSQTVFDNGVIVSNYIGNEAVVGTKIAGGAITTDKLSANAVTANNIAANAIRTEHMQADSINGDRIKTGTLNADAIKAGTITSQQIATGAIIGSSIAAGTITSDNIKTGSITGDRIAAYSIKANNLQVDALSSITAKIGTLRTADTGARTEIHDNLIEVYDKNNILRVRMGVWE